MRTLLAGALVVTALGVGSVFAQAPAGGPITRLDPALDAIVPPNTKLEVLVDDYFGSSEGPVWVKDGPAGSLLFSDQAANRIYKWDGKLSVFMEPSGYTGDPAKWPDVAQLFFNNRLHIGLVGSNGLAIDGEGRLIMCARGDRALVRIEKNGMRTVLADRYKGQRFLAPNDLAVKSDGSVYFSAPGPPVPDSAPSGLYRWRNGVVQMLAPDFGGSGTVNGLAFSPDEKFLYVIVGGKVVRAVVKPDGTLGDSRVFSNETGADGLKVDVKGNLYFAGPGGLWIVAPDGKHLGTIPMGRFTNVAFGDPDRKSLYLMIQRGLGRVKLNIPGI